MMIPTTNRDLHIDSMKGLLILTVVFGHFLELNLGSRTNVALYNTIYSFHMPLFIFLSGFFTHIKDQRSYFRGVLLLFEVFAAGSAYQLLNGIPQTASEWLMPRWTMWYLLTLCYYRVLAYFVPAGQRLRIALLILSAATALGVGFVPWAGREFSLSRTVVLLPFFLLGFYAQHSDPTERLHDDRWQQIIAILLFAVVFAVYYQHNHLEDKILYSNAPYRQAGDWLRRLAFLGGAIILSAACFHACPASRILAEVGRSTLPIYLFHTFAIVLLRSLFLQLHYKPGPMVLLAASCVTAVLLTGFARCRLCTWLLHPISSLTWQMRHRKREKY